MPVSKRRTGVRSKQSRRSTNNMSNQDKPQLTKEPVSFQLEYNIPSDLPTLYSDNLLLQNRDGLFFMHFLQNQVPVAFTKEELRSIDTVQSTCFARIAITPIQFAKNIKAMEENFNRYLKASNSPAKTYKEFLALLEKAE